MTGSFAGFVLPGVLSDLGRTVGLSYRTLSRARVMRFKKYIHIPCSGSCAVNGGRLESPILSARAVLPVLLSYRLLDPLPAKRLNSPQGQVGAVRSGALPRPESQVLHPMNAACTSWPP